MTGQDTASAASVLAALTKLADAEYAKNAGWFFKTGPGQYGEGDRFLGLRVPQTRQVAKRFRHLEPAELFDLAHSPWHEARLCAIFIFVDQFRRAKPGDSQELFESYLRLLEDGAINNWDLVDSSAPYLGQWLIGNPAARQQLLELAASPSLWQRRVAIMFTFAFIRAGDFGPTIELANILLHDKHDLIHKAVGWMLREVGNRDVAELRAFLKLHAGVMPRTMLRYSIEKLSPEERAEWLAAKANLPKTT